MKTAGPIFVIRLARPDASTGTAWAGKVSKGGYTWGDRLSAHTYAREAMARRQFIRIAQLLEGGAGPEEQLHLDRHPSRMAFLEDPPGTRTTLCAMALRTPVAS